MSAARDRDGRLLELVERAERGEASLARPTEAEGPPPTKAFPAIAPDSPAFSGLAGAFVRLIGPASEADPAALLLQCLAAFGNAANRGAHVRVEGAEHGLNLNVLLVGRTASGRKGTSWGRVRELMSQVDDGWLAARVVSGVTSGEGITWAVRDPILKTVRVRERGLPDRYEEQVEDAGVDDKRLLALESEFASVLRVLKRDTSTTSATLRQAWDSGDLRILTKNSPVRATGAHISLIGHITADELRRELERTEVANGFLNRFLIACVQRSKCLPEGGALNPRHLQALALEMREALDFARKAGELHRSELGRELWHAVYPELSAGRPGLLGAVLSRAEAQVTRLSCLYAVLGCSAVILPEHLEAALAVWDYCEASARFVFGDALGDPLADQVLALLRTKPDGVTLTEIRDHFGRNKASDEIQRSLTLLHEHGMATWTARETGGRPAVIWAYKSFLSSSTKPSTAASTSTPSSQSHYDIDDINDISRVVSRQKEGEGSTENALEKYDINDGTDQSPGHPRPAAGLEPEVGP